MTLFLHFDGGFSMADSILDSITEQYHSLTKSGKKLADYVFSHTTETQYLSITSLAENCKVSEATITRFCRGLGLSGYNAFKLALAVIPLNPYLLKILFLLYVRKCTQPIFFL